MKKIKMIDDHILDEHLLKMMVESMAEEWKQLVQKIRVVDRDDFDEAILMKDIIEDSKKPEKCVIKCP